MDFADEITLTGLRAFGRHGVYEEERRDGQDFVVDATLYVSTKRAAETDDVADTVHYGEVAERIVELVQGDPVNLLESLADRIARDILTGYPLVRRISVTIHKPQAPLTVPFQDVAVTVRRSREESSAERAIGEIIDDIIDDALFGDDE